MAADSLRIEELRRRVRKDPASIAFAQLGEEYRRAGEFEEAVRVCTAGLERHPAYLSARVTLGGALMELGRLDEARTEFEQVLVGAPDNLIARRSMDALRQRRGGVPQSGPPAARKETAAPAPTAIPERDPEAPVLAELEGWLAAIIADRK